MSVDTKSEWKSESITYQQTYLCRSYDDHNSERKKKWYSDVLVLDLLPVRKTEMWRTKNHLNVHEQELSIQWCVPTSLKHSDYRQYWTISSWLWFDTIHIICWSKVQIFAASVIPVQMSAAVKVTHPPLPNVAHMFKFLRQLKAENFF